MAMFQSFTYEFTKCQTANGSIELPDTNHVKGVQTYRVPYTHMGLNWEMHKKK